MAKEDLHQGHAMQKGFFGDIYGHLWGFSRKVSVIGFNGAFPPQDLSCILLMCQVLNCGGGEQELTEKSMRELSSNRKTAYVLIGMSYVGLFSC